ncbi:MAG TPA: chromosome partitioning protein ParB [Polyangiaceae bacterium]|jgi:ParB family chromosome partitioning protein
MAAKKTRARAPGTKRRRGVKIQPTELAAAELTLEEVPPEVQALSDLVRADGGTILSRYREPLGGHALLLVGLPIERVKPTPFQRDVSDAHVLRLTRAMDKTKRFLDPVIAVRHGEEYLTPNGAHRLTALRELGAKAVVALLVPEASVAYQILALNIEKAHNLRERALEVVRMYRDLQSLSDARETDYELEFEDPSLVTLGFAYEQRGRLAGGAYGPILRKVDQWISAPLRKAAAERERRAALLLELDDAVNDAVARLKAQGLVSPYLKTFVVARVNPLRFIKGELPDLDQLLSTMTRRARSLKTEGVKPGDLARAGGPSGEE